MQLEIAVSESLEAEALTAWGSVVSAQSGEVARINAQATVSATVSAAQNAALARADASGALAVSVV